MSGHGTSHLLPTYARVDLAFERGEGAWLVATDGERYLDFTSGVAVNALGHAHPHLVAAITEQARKLMARLQPLPHPGGRAAGRRGCARRASPTRCSSPIPAPRRWSARSRWRASTSRRAASRSATASSPSRAPSTAARWRRSPPAARRNISKASARWSTASTRCRSATSKRSSARSGRRPPRS